jgi:hypothetical protein
LRSTELDRKVFAEMICFVLDRKVFTEMICFILDQKVFAVLNWTGRSRFDFLSCSSELDRKV